MCSCALLKRFHQISTFSCRFSPCVTRDIDSLVSFDRRIVSLIFKRYFWDIFEGAFSRLGRVSRIAFVLSSSTVFSVERCLPRVPHLDGDTSLSLSIMKCFFGEEKR